MALNLSNFTSKLSPKAKQGCVIGLAVTALVGALCVTLGTDKRGPQVRWNEKTDKQVSVITNDNQKFMGVDAMAGRIKYLDNENRKLKEQVQGIIKDRQTDKADTTKEREWKERFDALTSEVNKLRAQQRDASVMMNGLPRGNGPATKPGQAQIDNPFEVREQKRRELLGDDLENSIRGSAGKGTSGGARTGGTSIGSSSIRRGSGTLQINVVGDPNAKDETEVKMNNSSFSSQSQEGTAFIPAGSILTGTLITGAEFPTGGKARENPTPVLIRLSKKAILPNRFQSDVRECFMLASGHGDLSTERASMRSEMISCVRTDGTMIQTKISGYVAGEDGKAGMRGRLVSKTGAMIARTMVAGFLAGMSEAFDYNPVEVLSTTATNNVQYQSKWSQDAVKGGFAQGATKALDKVADYYMNLADQMTPVVEIGAGRQVDVIVIAGTKLNVMKGTDTSDIVQGNNQTMRPTDAANKPIGR